MKDFEDYTFEEVVDYEAGNILKALISGQFRNGVYQALNHMCHWYQAQDEKKKKK